MTKVVDGDAKANWFKRHKILTVFLGVLTLIVIGGISAGNKEASKLPSPPATSSKYDGSITCPAGVEPGSDPGGQCKTGNVSTPEPAAKPKFDGQAFYDKIQNGMTKDQLVSAAGKPADNCSESEIQGYGKSEYCTWYDGSFSSKFISVTLKDGIVDTKSRNGY